MKAYILQAIAANEGTDCRFVLNAKEIERFSVAMHMKISLRAAFAYLLIGHIQSQKQARSFNLDSDEEDICMAQTNKFTQS